VVECGGLENRYRCKPIEGSNPSSSATCLFIGIHWKVRSTQKPLLSGAFSTIHGDSELSLSAEDDGILWGELCGWESLMV
jgi:hypothetical protein